MRARLIFFAIAAFWLTMNGLLWRSEYGTRAGETPVPIGLVWQKILTAPDESSLSVYQNSDRTGWCKFSTSVGREMAAVDADKPPPEGLVKRAGYQIHMEGNVALGAFTNRLSFGGQLLFSSARQWQEVNLKFKSRQTVLEIHSVATNQMLHLKINSDGGVFDVDLKLTDLLNPNTLLPELADTAAGTLLAAMDLTDLSNPATAGNLGWRASRTRVKIGSEAVTVYRIETSVLGREVLVEVSTLGEILRVKLPGNISARLDDWVKP